MSDTTKYKIREMLSAPYYIARNIEFREEQIKRLRDLAERSTSSYTAERVGGTQERSKVESAVVRIVELTDMLVLERAALAEKEREALDLIKQVPNGRQRAVLEAYHVNRLRVWEIAQKMHFSEITIKRDLRKGREWIEKNCKTK